MPRSDSPLAGAEDGNDLDPGAFDHVVGSLEDRSVNGLTERISGMDFLDADASDARFSMGEYNMGVGQDGLSPSRPSEGMGSIISLEGEDLNNRSSLSAFEGVDRESYAPARNSLEALSGPRTSLENPFAGSDDPSTSDAGMRAERVAPITITDDSKRRIELPTAPECLVAFDDEKGFVGAEGDWVNAAQTPADKLDQIKAGGAAAVLTTPKQLKREQSKCDIAEVRQIWSNCCGSRRNSSAQSPTAGHDGLPVDKKRASATRELTSELMIGRRTSQKLNARDSPSVTEQRKYPTLDGDNS